MTANSVLVIAVIVGIVVTAFVLGMQLQKLLSRFTAMQERLAKLEEAKRTRNPWPTNDGLEDAMAVLNDAAWNASETLNYIQTRTAQALDILKTVRSCPDQYDPDQPNQKQAR